MSPQPQACFGCPMFGKATGFILGTGNPETAKVAVIGEAPGREELIWHVDEAEVARRRQRYPELEEKFLRIGAPFVGKSGSLLFSWGLAPVQLTRNDVFLDNCLRCLPPTIKGSQYPTGSERKAAEAHCRQWDRWDEFGPTVDLIQIHPAFLAREPSPLPLHIKVWEKAKHFSLGGERPLVLCGGKAVGMWLGYGSTVQTWLGHYQVETPLVASQREKRRLTGMATKTGPKVKKPRKLTARTALELLLRDAHPVVMAPVNDLDGNLLSSDIQYHLDVHVTEAQYVEMLALAATKPKKVKETK